MIPYYLLVGIPTVMAMLFTDAQDVERGRKHRRVIILTFFAILFLILSLRDSSVGVDLQIYLPRYNSVGRTEWGGLLKKFASSEPGFILLNKLVYGLTAGNEQIYLAIVGLICTLPFARLYSKESENAMLTLALFLVFPTFPMLFSGLRQAIAIALVVPAYIFTREKKLIKFLITVVLATMFHTTAVLLLIMYPVYHMKIKRSTLIIVLPVLALIFAFNRQLFGLLQPLLGEEYKDYVISETGSYTMLVLFVLLAAFSYIAPRDRELDKETVGLRNLLVLSVAIQLFSPISTIAMRVNYYFIVLIPLLIPRIINRTSEKNRKIYKLIGFGMVAFFLVYYLVKANVGSDILQTYPYKAFWE